MNPRSGSHESTVAGQNRADNHGHMNGNVRTPKRLLQPPSAIAEMYFGGESIFRGKAPTIPTNMQESKVGIARWIHSIFRDSCTKGSARS